MSDPARQAELTKIFLRKLAYIRESFLIGHGNLGDGNEFNESLEQLRIVAKFGRTEGAEFRRLHPTIEVAINRHARTCAAERTGDANAAIQAEDVALAASIFVSKAEKNCHRPQAFILRHHVEGLMALFQETSGMPVLASKTRNSVYEPHLVGEMGRVLLEFFQELCPQVTETQIANIVLEARKKYAGKHMRFRDFFPFYGAHYDAANGTLKGCGGIVVEDFGLCRPTYSPYRPHN